VLRPVRATPCFTSVMDTKSQTTTRDVYAYRCYQKLISVEVSINGRACCTVAENEMKGCHWFISCAARSVGYCVEREAAEQVHRSAHTCRPTVRDSRRGARAVDD